MIGPRIQSSCGAAEHAFDSYERDRAWEPDINTEMDGPKSMRMVARKFVCVGLPGEASGACAIMRRFLTWRMPLGRDYRQSLPALPPMNGPAFRSFECVMALGAA
jgi:hypothetical protein